MTNPVTPPDHSLSRDDWTETMNVVATTHPHEIARELATFCAEVLARCGDTPELSEFLDRRALRALESA